MNDLLRLALLLVLLTCCSMIKAQHAPCSITGQVTDPQQKPVDAALVWLVTPDGNSRANYSKPIPTIPTNGTRSLPPSDLITK